MGKRVKFEYILLDPYELAEMKGNYGNLENSRHIYYLLAWSCVKEKQKACRNWSENLRSWCVTKIKYMLSRE